MGNSIELLSKRHKKEAFTCGKAMLDNYFHHQASQDVKRKLAACFVWEDAETGVVKGYYTLSNSSIPWDLIPSTWRKKLPPSYASIPVTLLGRLAVDIRFQGGGLGQILLVDALKRSFEVSAEIGSFAVVADPLDGNAQVFYQKFGFIELPDSGKMFIAMHTLKELFAPVSEY